MSAKFHFTIILLLLVSFAGTSDNLFLGDSTYQMSSFDIPIQATFKAFVLRPLGFCLPLLSSSLKPDDYAESHRWLERT